METSNNYRDTLVSTGASSQKYGNCEVCGEFAAEVVQRRRERKAIPLVAGKDRWISAGNTFGHRECLERGVTR